MTKITVLLKDLDDFKEMNEHLADFLSECEVLPVRTTLQPAQMPLGSRFGLSLFFALCET